MLMVDFFFKKKFTPLQKSFIVDIWYSSKYPAVDDLIILLVLTHLLMFFFISKHSNKGN